LVATILYLATDVVDFCVHPGMFRSVVTEAIATGIFAGIFPYVIGSEIGYFRESKALPA
jgi:hypothetical protein